MTTTALITEPNQVVTIFNGIKYLLSLPVVTALAGVIITQLLQIKSKKMELKYQKETNEQQLKKEYLEKMFLGLRAIDSDARLIYRAYMSVFANQLQLTSARQQINEQRTGNNDFYNYGEIYFPELFDSCQKNIASLKHEIMATTCGYVLSSELNIENCTRLQAAMEKWADAIQESKNLIRAEIQKV